MISEMKAKFTCDECGDEFWVLLDPAYDPPDGWTLFDAALDALRGNARNEDNNGKEVDCGDELDGKHLCHACANAID